MFCHDRPMFHSLAEERTMEQQRKMNRVAFCGSITQFIVGVAWAIVKKKMKKT